MGKDGREKSGEERSERKVGRRENGSERNLESGERRKFTYLEAKEPVLPVVGEIWDLSGNPAGQPDLPPHLYLVT